jgi:hypothetical protein
LSDAAIKASDEFNFSAAEQHVHGQNQSNPQQQQQQSEQPQRQQEEERDQPQPQRQQQHEYPLPVKLAGKHQPAHKFDPTANKSLQEKALSAFIDAIAAIPRISLSRASIAEAFAAQPCKCECAYEGTVLMRQYEVSSVVIYLISGSVSVLHDGETRAVIQAPAMIGHHSFIYHRARTAAIVCASHVAYFMVALDELLCTVKPPFPALDAGPTGSGSSSVLTDPVDSVHNSSDQFPQMLFASHHANAPALYTSASDSISAFRGAASDAFKAAPPRVSPSEGKHSFNSRPLHAARDAQSSIHGQPSGVSFSHPVVQPLSPAHPPIFSSTGSGLAGMSVTDSLGMMMRQHDVCFLFLFFLFKATYSCRKQTLLPNWYWKR